MTTAASSESHEDNRAFVVNKSDKKSKSSLYVVKSLDSPFGLGTTDQIPDFEELSDQVLETVRRWFMQEGVEEWLEESETKNATTLKFIHKIVKK